MIRLDPTRLALLRPSASPGPAAEEPLALVARMVEHGVHEIAEARFGDFAAATGLAAAALRLRPAGALLWVSEARLRREHGRMSARGLQAMGGDPGRVLAAEAAKTRDALWCVEEGLRSGAVAAVVAELSEADFTATRRFALASRESGVPAILLLPHTREGATAAESRWRVRALPSAPNPYDAEAPGAVRWQAVLERSRAAPGAVGRRLDLEVEDETHRLCVVAGLADRPAAQSGRLARRRAVLKRTG